MQIPFPQPINTTSPISVVFRQRQPGSCKPIANMSFLPRLKLPGALSLVHKYCLITSLLFWQTTIAGKDDYGGGYSYGQAIPVTCLNRSIETGDHVEDTLGKLQYIPFPTCNETGLPLSLRYGISETVTCTIASLPDTMYHLLEYYVHSDVPLSCHIPTVPLRGFSEQKQKQEEDEDERKESDGGNNDNNNSVFSGEQPYTPLTIAVQGTLQKSHLHIWTDMNLIMHSIASTPQKNKKKRNTRAAPGYAVAGTAYSLPEYDGEGAQSQSKSPSSSDDKTPKPIDEKAVIKAARDPWTSGHGTKVIRGEPLTFTFHVGWIEGAAGIRWPSSSSSSSSPLALSSSTQDYASSSFISRLVFFVLAAGAGALAAVYWERYRNTIVSYGSRRRGGKRGDGILGVSVGTPAASGISYGGGAGGNAGGNGYGYGYGGYSASRDAGGFASGKRD
ncbi:hypothetical protein MAP00_003417 [Monascus purpureus]|nr:hypothetical protein MAP00_003417 [Monascus purpureus]